MIDRYLMIMDDYRWQRRCMSWFWWYQLILIYWWLRLMKMIMLIMIDDGHINRDIDYQSHMIMTVCHNLDGQQRYAGCQASCSVTVWIDWHRCMKPSLQWSIPSKTGGAGQAWFGLNSMSKAVGYCCSNRDLMDRGFSENINDWVKYTARSGTQLELGMAKRPQGGRYECFWWVQIWSVF